MNNRLHSLAEVAHKNIMETDLLAELPAKELRFCIFTTGAELCARLDQLVELDRRRVEALEGMLVLGEEKSRVLKAQWQAKSTPAGPFSTTAASTEGGEILSTEPSGGENTSA